MNALSNVEPGNLLPIRLLFFTVSAFTSNALPSYAKSAGEILSDYGRLPNKEREVKILEGAKREGKMVYYGTTAVDHIQRVFAEFKKKYPFVDVADYMQILVELHRFAESTAPSCE